VGEATRHAKPDEARRGRDVELAAVHGHDARGLTARLQVLGILGTPAERGELEALSAQRPPLSVSWRKLKRRS
jgi:hypothetical protein